MPATRTAVRRTISAVTSRLSPPTLADTFAVLKVATPIATVAVFAAAFAVFLEAVDYADAGKLIGPEFLRDDTVGMAAVVLFVYVVITVLHAITRYLTTPAYVPPARSRWETDGDWTNTRRLIAIDHEVTTSTTSDPDRKHFDITTGRCKDAVCEWTHTYASFGADTTVRSAHDLHLDRLTRARLGTPTPRVYEMNDGSVEVLADA